MIRKFGREYLVLAACLIAGLLFLAFYPQPAGAQQAVAKSCPSTMPGDSTELECSCPPTGGGAVWGTDFYTDDSSLCDAAVHAGAIPATGGIIRARATPGRDYYTGSRSNGIISNDYGTWSRSIAFDGAKSVSAESTGVPLCPGTYRDGGAGWSGTCRCVDTATGAVWGSGTYTTDSNLCRAARHAGAVGEDGGLVQVASAPGQGGYSGTMRNGVTTSDWGSFDSSFRVSAASAK
jgi:hypothetical protein